MCPPPPLVFLSRAYRRPSRGIVCVTEENKKNERKTKRCRTLSRPAHHPQQLKNLRLLPLDLRGGRRERRPRPFGDRKGPPVHPQGALVDPLGVLGVLPRPRGELRTLVGGAPGSGRGDPLSASRRAPRHPGPSSAGRPRPPRESRPGTAASFCVATFLALSLGDGGGTCAAAAAAGAAVGGVRGQRKQGEGEAGGRAEGALGGGGGGGGSGV